MAIIVSTIQINSIHATREKVLLKSIPSICVNPLATKQTLCLATKPSTLYLILKIHLQLTSLQPSGKRIIKSLNLIIL
jgi:hypothetical protein